MRLITAVLIFLTCNLMAKAQTVSHPETQVGAIYHHCFDHPSHHFTSRSGQTALSQHFQQSKAVHGNSVEWHTGQLDRMMEASLDFVAVAWPLHGEEAKSRSIIALKALVEARTAILKAGGHPPKLSLFIETMPHVEAAPNEGIMDLRTEEARKQLTARLMEFFLVATPLHRHELDGFLPIFFGPAGVTPHNRDFFHYLLFVLKRQLKAKPYFVVERSWNAQAQASFTDGAPLHGPADDGPIAFIGPGFDDQSLPHSGGPIRNRESSRFYRHSFDQLLLRRLSLVVIDSWNQFHVGTGIAPSKEYGDEYIKLTHRYIHMLKARALPDIKKPVRLAHPSPISRPDKGWWKPAPRQKTAVFNPGAQPGNAGKGIRIARVPHAPFERKMTGDQASIRSMGRGAPTTYLYFGVADEFLHNTAQCIEVTVEFLGGGNGSLRMQYDSWRIGEKKKGAYSSTPRHSRQGLPRKRTAKFLLPEARFGNRQNGGADFRLEIRGDELEVFRVSATPISGEAPSKARLIIE